ncbi:hypothetical protein LTS02_018423, partial [Friedmanniomyces endolithicus]
PQRPDPRHQQEVQQGRPRWPQLRLPAHLRADGHVPGYLGRYRAYRLLPERLRGLRYGRVRARRQLHPSQHGLLPLRVPQRVPRLCRRDCSAGQLLLPRRLRPRDPDPSHKDW